MTIEPLEIRIAPAAIFTFTDTDGDRVTVKTSKGSNAELEAALTFDTASDVPRQLQKIDLSNNANFVGTDISVIATRIGPGGDGVTAVGFIDASTTGGGAAFNLGKITIDGDLGRILAGTGGSVTAVKSLTVGSIGLLGTTTQAGGGDLVSTIQGVLPTLVVKTDFTAGSFSADITGSVKISGTLAGDLGVGGSIGSIFIGGDLDGSELSAGKVGKFTVLGSIIGGAGVAAGRFFASEVGSVFVGGDIRAGTVIDSGVIEISGDTGSIIVKGSILSDSTSANGTGGIRASNMKSLFIGGSIVSSTLGSGGVNVDDVGSITIGGDLRGGRVDTGTVGKFIVRGSLIGGSTEGSGTITGGVQSMFVGGDLRAGAGDLTGLLNLSTTKSSVIVVRGSLIADIFSGENAASIFTDSAGSIFVGGDMIGTSAGSGSINCGSIASIFVGGVLQGGFGENSAQIDAANVGKLRVGSVIGGSGDEAGSFSLLSVGSLLIAGDVRGGSDDRSGRLFIAANADNVEIRGSLIGGTADVITAIPVAIPGGQIEIGGNVKSFKLTGDLRGGSGDNTAIISIGGNVDVVSIGGNIVGNTFSTGSRGGARFFAVGKIGKFTLTGDLAGDGTDSAKILSGSGINTLIIGGDVIGGEGARSGAVVTGTEVLGSLSIGGSIRGGDGADSARLEMGNSLATTNKISIRGDIRGGAGLDSGVLELTGGIGTITIGGSIVGGSNSGAGGLLVTNEDGDVPISLNVLGEVRGGLGDSTGLLQVMLPFDAFSKSVKIGRSIEGGVGSGSGIVLLSDTKTVTVGGSILAGNGTNSGVLELNNSRGSNLLITGDVRGGVDLNSGRIITEGLNKLFIGGSVIAGNTNTTIIKAETIADFQIKGSVLGESGVIATISVNGDRTREGVNQNDILIGKLTVGGSVQFARILTGLAAINSIQNSDAKIGNVTVTGDWIASDLVAGVTAGAGNRFGDATDTFTPALDDLAGEISSIASITIGGRVRGTAGAGDNFGFVAQQITAFKIAGEKVALVVGGVEDVVAVSATNDVTIREVL